jgi:hypothetical protein
MSPSKLSRLEWHSLVLPWAAVLMLAVVAALLQSSDDDHAPAEDVLGLRRLWTDDGYVPPSEETFYAHSTAVSAEEAEAWAEPPPRPVFDEDHPTLFPLTAKDYAGFILAVLGLMVAVGD